MVSVTDHRPLGRLVIHQRVRQDFFQRDDDNSSKCSCLSLKFSAFFHFNSILTNYLKLFFNQESMLHVNDKLLFLDWWNSYRAWLGKNPGHASLNGNLISTTVFPKVILTQGELNPSNGRPANQFPSSINISTFFFSTCKNLQSNVLANISKL